MTPYESFDSPTPWTQDDENSLLEDLNKDEEFMVLPPKGNSTEPRTVRYNEVDFDKELQDWFKKNKFHKEETSSSSNKLHQPLITATVCNRFTQPLLKKFHKTKN